MIISVRAWQSLLYRRRYIFSLSSDKYSYCKSLWIKSKCSLLNAQNINVELVHVQTCYFSVSYASLPVLEWKCVRCVPARLCLRSYSKTQTRYSINYPTPFAFTDGCSEKKRLGMAQEPR